MDQATKRRSLTHLVEEFLPSNRTLWGLVGFIALLGVALVWLESGLEDEPLPNYIWAADGETSEAEIEYAERLGVDPTQVQLDISAVEEIDRLDLRVCPAIDEPAVPDELALGAPVECPAFDGHGGVAYPLVATAIAAAGAGLAAWRRNRIGFLLILVVLIDMVGAVVGAYALRSLVVKPGTLVGGHVAAFIGSITWIALLVVAVPLLLLTFPNGKLISSRWRWVAYVGLAIAVTLAAIQLLHPFLIGPVLNPFRASWSISTANSAFDLANTAWLVLMLVVLASLAWRLALWARRRLLGRGPTS